MHQELWRKTINDGHSDSAAESITLHDHDYHRAGITLEEG